MDQDRITSLASAIDRATAAERWDLADRLTSQLDRLTTSEGRSTHAEPETSDNVVLLGPRRARG